jgi:hypothetical protein
MNWGPRFELPSSIPNVGLAYDVVAIENRIEIKTPAKRLPRVRILYANHVATRGIELYEAISERDCEGIVAMHRESTNSTSASWLKILDTAYTQKEGKRELFEKFHSRRQPAFVPSA